MHAMIGIFKMDVAKYVPGSCNSNWKRWDMGEEAAESTRDLGYGTEIIDGVEYPLLPDHVVGW